MSENPDASPRVPAFRVLYGKPLPEMNRLQASFYRRQFQPRFHDGEIVATDEQNGYAVVMLHELVSLWDAEPESAMDGMRRLREAYGRESVGASARRSLADMHYLRGEWAEALEHTGGYRLLPAMLGLADVLQPRIEAWMVQFWGSPSITSAGYRYLDEALDDLQVRLDLFHDEHGVSVIDHFWARLHADEPLEELAASLEEQLGTHYSVARIAELIALGRTYGPTGLTAFVDFDDYKRPIDIPSPWPQPYAFEGLWRQLFRRMFRESENRAREGAGLPRVGEGNVSETGLLLELRAAFPHERIDHQVRPWWLAPQSLDMVFAHRNVALEFQGIQHQQAVDFFGGPEAFERQQDRDANKQWLCEKHGMHLIEVFPDYKLADVVLEVRAALDASARASSEVE